MNFKSLPPHEWKHKLRPIYASSVCSSQMTRFELKSEKEKNKFKLKENSIRNCLGFLLVHQKSKEKDCLAAVALWEYYLYKALRGEYPALHRESPALQLLHQMPALMWMKTITMTPWTICIKQRRYSTVQIAFYVICFFFMSVIVAVLKPFCSRQEV